MYIQWVCIYFQVHRVIAFFLIFYCFRILFNQKTAVICHIDFSQRNAANNSIEITHHYTLFFVFFTKEQRKHVHISTWQSAQLSALWWCDNPINTAAINLGNIRGSAILEGNLQRIFV